MYVNQHPKRAESMDASFAASTSMCLITLDSLVGPAFTPHLSLRAMQWSSSSRSRSKTWAVCQNVTRRSDLIWFLWLDETTTVRVDRGQCVFQMCAICANWRKLMTRDYGSPEHSLSLHQYLFTACHSKKTCKVNTYCSKTDTKWISDSIYLRIIYIYIYI